MEDYLKKQTKKLQETKAGGSQVQNGLGYTQQDHISKKKKKKNPSFLYASIFNPFKFCSCPVNVYCFFQVAVNCNNIIC
jgi:hypothetical protein